jgi:hypothetical protein
MSTTVEPIKMSKELMKARIQELLKGDKAAAQRRVEVCLWGLEKSKGGPEMVNQLIDELGLAAFGQSKRALA